VREYMGCDAVCRRNFFCLRRVRTKRNGAWCMHTACRSKCSPAEESGRTGTFSGLYIYSEKEMHFPYWADVWCVLLLLLSAASGTGFQHTGKEIWWVSVGLTGTC
jgi:hypothetical protein